MKNFSKIAGATLLTLGLAVLPAHATSTTGTSTDAGTAVNNAAENTADAAADNTDRDYNDGDWGLLGLLGLFGLLGRRSRPTEPTAYQDPGVTTSRTGSDRY